MNANGIEAAALPLCCCTTCTTCRLTATDASSSACALILNQFRYSQYIQAMYSPVRRRSVSPVMRLKTLADRSTSPALPRIATMRRRRLFSPPRRKMPLTVSSALLTCQSLSIQSAAPRSLTKVPRLRLVVAAPSPQCRHYDAHCSYLSLRWNPDVKGGPKRDRRRSTRQC